jgi:beta-lactamase superfamily II metal-dependent hydrolase
MRRFLNVVAVLVLGLQAIPQTQASRLQIHFMDVGQGDGAILIAPSGETVLFDNGVWNQCTKPSTYLASLGITKVDYQIISHYHRDHYGCTATVLGRFPLQQFSLDRGGSYHDATAFNSYLGAVGSKRQTATDGQVITLGAGTANVVTITIKALNGNGVPTDNENDESVVALVSFGNFRAEMGGDLSGFPTADYQDIETSVAPKVGQVDVYKVHHHGSSHSSNNTWLQTVHPRIGIVSAGDTNTYGHPDFGTMDRIHNAGVKTYWTSKGNGVAAEDGMDVVGGTIIVEVPSVTSTTYTVRPTAAGTTTDTYQTWITTSGPITPTGTTTTFSWSKRSNIYHDSRCRFVANISPANLQTGTTPPPGKTLHKDCPK